MRTLNGSGRSGWRQFVVFILGTCLCWGPIFTAQAQDDQAKARSELQRVTPLMDNAKTSTALAKAIQEGRQAIDDSTIVNNVTGGQLVSLINTANKAYADASMRLITMLTGGCENGKFKEDGRAAKTMLFRLEEDVPKFLDKAKVKKLKTRLQNCLGSVTKYQGTDNVQRESGSHQHPDQRQGRCDLDAGNRSQAHSASASLDLHGQRRRQGES